MKILICISKTPDTTAKIAFTDNNTKFAADGVQWIINPYDEWYALVRAIELKEADASITLDLITVGGADAEPIMRKALALGGDKAIRVNLDHTDSFVIATQLAEVARNEKYDLIFTGKETIDYNGSSIGGMLAEMLDLPFVNQATHFDLNTGKATISREIEGGEEVVSCALPLVVTKPLQVLEPIACEPLTAVHAFEMPPAKSGVKLIDPAQPEELVRLLHEEAKAI
jgi:electron transfer flavoprotein beta subunit